MNARTSLALLTAALGLLSAAPGTLRAQGATLLRDVRTVVDAGGYSGFSRGVDAGGFALFFAGDRVHGRELWRSDGTAGGTRLVRDLYPGITASEYIVSQDFMRLGSTVYFIADDGGEGAEIHRSDGTSAGTVIAFSLAPGAERKVYQMRGTSSSRFFFEADDASFGRELWVSDGTAAGTRMLVDAAPGSSSSSHNYFTVIGDVAYYNAGAGSWLWKSDGTPAGTQEVARVRLASGIASLSGVLYFAASPESDLQNVELWRSDGTAAGTWRVADIVAGSEASQPQSLVRLGSRIYFKAATASTGRELWSTQGTAATTQPLIDLVPGTVGSNPDGLQALGTRLVFSVRDSAAGSYRGLWSHPGVGGSADKIGEVMTTQFDPAPYVPLGSSWVFQGTSTTSGDVELYRTDGTTPGTQLVSDIHPTGSSSPLAFVAISSTRVLFWALASDGRRNLWRTDGTGSGTVLVKDFTPPAASSEPSFAEPENVLDPNNRYRFRGLGAGSHPERRLATFAADDGAAGREPWQSDGSAMGTSLLRDLHAGSSSSDPYGFARVRGFTLFGATEPSVGTELFRTDDTAAGTVLAVDLTPGTSSRGIMGFTEHRGRATFTDVGQNHLYITDGTASGTALLRDIGSNSQLRNFRWIGERLWFGSYGSEVGISSQLLLSDGTAAGTQALASFGARMFAPSQFTELGGRVFFVAQDSTHGLELWSSDGTPGGTALAIDIVPGTGSGNPFDLVHLGDRLYFVAYTSATGRELWSIGAALDLQLVADINPGSDSSAPMDLRVMGDRIYFSASDGVSGRELWASDGTPGGTWRVIDLAPGIATALPAVSGYLLALPGAEKLLFTASDGVSGLELWSTDGTAAGTRLVADIAPGVSACHPSTPALYGNRLYFAADDGVHGREPWVLPSPAAAIPYGAGCAGTGGRIPTLVGASGAPRLGNASFAVELREALASTPAALEISLLPFDFPLGSGCDLLVDPLGGLNSQLGATNASGVARFALPIPAEPLLVGAQAFLQGLALDPQGSLQGLLAFSPGLALILAEG